MKRARKSNRVSWAPGPNLRQNRTSRRKFPISLQVKLFYSDEDHSSKVGEKSQDNHRAKTPMVNSTTDEYDELPPGFEGNRFQNPSKLELSRIPQIKWECPPMFALSNHWRVAAGENSKAKDDEKQREKNVFEAMYPRISAIPSSPYISSGVEKESYDDNLTPHIPIEVRDDDDIADISIEEREAVVDPEPHVADAEHGNTLTRLQPQKLPPAISSIASQCDTSVVPFCTCGKPILQTTSLVADLLAASAVVAAFMKCNEELLKIFNDPIMMDKLIREYKTATASISASSSAVSITNSDSEPATSSVPISKPTPESEVSETTPTNTVDSLLPVSETRQAIPSVSLLTPTPENPVVPEMDAVSSVSLLTSTLENPATVTPPIPLSKPFSCQSATTISVTMPTPLPPPISTPHMYRPVNQNIPLVPNTVVTSTIDRLAIPPATPSVPLSMPLSGQLAAIGSLAMPTPLTPPISTPLMYRPVTKNIPLVPDGPQQTQAVSSGVKRAAPSASVPSIELNTLAAPSVSANIHAGTKRMRSTQPGAGSTSSVVKDVNYYKSLIWQHGSEKKRKQDSQIEGTSHNKSTTKPGEAKFKKQCKFFKTSKGCRNGSNCPYQHDRSEAGDVPVAQSAKRVKVGTEVKWKL